ncbi:MAG: alanine racemase [Bacteroidales bacterium]|nr:alanine racemase [Bacteroidales bacterium]
MSNSFLIIEKRVRKNIERIAEKARVNNVVLRPHFKTHQNLQVASFFKDYGISAITVSSIRMARFFAAKGWKDIFIAFPLDVNEIAEMDLLAKQVNLMILINHPEHIKALNQLTHSVDVMIEIDAGYHRSGIDVNSYEQVLELVRMCHETEHAIFVGLMAHFGNTYISRTKQQILGIAYKSANRLSDLAKKLERETGQFIYVSIGDTPSVSVLNQFDRIDEIRPGNFVFYDLMQLQIGSCELNDIAALMQCPVVSINSKRHELVIHGGAVHLSKESIDFMGVKTFGHIVKIEGENLSFTGDYVSSLSQEHGIVQCKTENFSAYNIGDQLLIVPVHSCLTANLMKEFIQTI